jgi:type VI secretion system FHA domain protein
MGFTLIVGTGTQSQDAAVQSRSFEKPIVTIGRAATCDVALKDVQRVVSSRHAEIRRKEDQFVLIDMGSTNGTFLNDRRITAGGEHPLQDGDCIGIGRFRLTFRDSQEVLRQQESPGEPRAAISVEAPRIECDQAMDRLVYLLRRAYPGFSPRGDDGCVPDIAELLRCNLRSFPEKHAKDLLRVIKEKFPTANSKRVPSDGKAPKLSISSQKGSGGIEPTSQLFSAIVRRYCPTAEMPLSPEISSKFLARLAHVLDVTFDSLADALKGRREFQRELEVDATRILSWNPNVIKRLETEQEIGRVLLDPTGKEISDERLEDELREVFQDLLLHQIGLLAGMQECLRGLLKEFAPAIFEREGGGQTSKQAASFFGGAQARRNSTAWEAFKRKHEKFSEEEVKLFETILAPYFVRGYLAVQKTKQCK